MKCPRCHSLNEYDSRFCANCGNPLRTEETLPAPSTRTLAVPLPALAKDSIIARKFRIDGELGRGGMGVVYRAEDTRLKRTVALKFLPPHLAELKERFLVEAQAAAGLSHPNICVVHEIGEAEGRPFIAMEYVEGETLRDRIRNKALTAEEALSVAIQVAAGLGEAHGKGIVHRDVKSANIMVTPKGRAKVMDFGLAKLRSGLSLTESRTTLGTIAYMSPEQARGEKVDGRTDVWSLGVVLYEMLTRELPFKGDHDQAVVHAIIHREPASLKKAKPDAPAGLEEVIFQALAKKPAARYQTMEELAEDLEAVAAGLKPLRARPARAIKLAVLPFANVSGDPDQEYLSDGLTQEMITQLGRLHPESLSVIARASVMRYKKGDTPVDRIGQELGVNYVLEGSALREANLVRINAVLIQVADQTQLWAESYKREFSGILTLQSEVAENVAKALSLKLLPSEKDMLAKARPVNPQAYDAYLKGQFHWAKLTPESFDTALRYFELARTEDPNFARAYAGISLVWLGRNQFGLALPAEAIARSKEAALKALELDDSLAEVHYALAGVSTWGEYNWESAGESFRRGVELNPNYPDVRAYYAHYLFMMHRSKEAVEQMDRTQELDPFNPLFKSLRAADLVFLHRYDEAIEECRSLLRTMPNHGLGLSILGYAYYLKGMLAEAYETNRMFYSAMGMQEGVQALTAGFEDGGYTGAKKKLAELWEQISQVAYVMPYYIAEAYITAGDNARALHWLEKGFEVRDPNMPYIGLFPYFTDNLKDEPRYRELLRRMKLPMGDPK
jgi:serine/threonine protein kinase/Tfp pilus assembly protein PilF